MPRRRDDLTGRRFGRRVVVGFSHVEISGTHGGGAKLYWKAICDCGRIDVVQAHALRAGLARQCEACAKAIWIRTMQSRRWAD